ncbi:MAG: ATP phosphoribosyltransferase regulatory subunit, partial [Gaiellaceae bacterium]
LLVNSIGDRACRPAYVERLESWLDEHEAELDDEARHKRATSPLRVFDTKNPRLGALLEDAPAIADSLCDDCRAHFEAVRRCLDACGIEYEPAPRLVRGLDYYTRTTYEFVAAGLGAQDTVSAGGRYDYLVETIGGPPTPGVGFAAGLERVVLALEEFGPSLDQPGIEVFFASEPETPRESVLKAMTRLRAQGVACDADFAGRSLKGQLTQAQRLGAATIVIAGPSSAIVRRQGEADVESAYDELEGMLR